MTMNRLLAVLCIIAFTVSHAVCDSTSYLKGQSNATLTFYGKAVDQNGKPLADAEFVVDVEAIPMDWTFETRGKPHDHSTITFKSGPDGRFAPDVTGHILRLTRVARGGYRHLFDQDANELSCPGNMFYGLSAWSDLCYRSDPDHPAVFVFVKEGVHEVSALPCKGGYDSGNGTYWYLNNPGWPKKPSLDDVRYTGPKPELHWAELPKPTVPDPNASDIVFYGLAVDQTGKPLKGAGFVAEIDQLPPASWSVPAGNNLKVWARTHTESGPDGRFEFLATGTTLRVDGNWAMYRLPGYFLLFDRMQTPPGQNISYSLGTARADRYRSDPDRPAVFVYVQRGVKEFSVKPSRGGCDTQDGGKTWTPTPPTWPKLPSIKGAFYKEAGVESKTR